jgi:hypothetical protein
MKTPPSIPPTTELAEALGDAHAVWKGLIAQLAQDFSGLREEWKPSKRPFGKVCLLKQKDRTLLYLLPDRSIFEVSIVLGERAVAIALAGDLPKEIKTMIAGARQYAEGRGIRFPVGSAMQIADIRKLVAIKTTPK